MARKRSPWWTRHALGLAGLVVVTGCAVADRTTLYEAPNPKRQRPGEHVLRIQVSRLFESSEYRCRDLELDAEQIARMMAAMYYRFVNKRDLLPGLPAALPDDPGAVSRDMSEAIAVFDPAEVQWLAPRLAEAAAALRGGEGLVIQVDALSGATPENPRYTEIRLGCNKRTLGRLGLSEEKARVDWTFIVLKGLRFRQDPKGKPRGYRYRGADYGFMVVFPRKHSGIDYVVSFGAGEP